jgi:hypothetical protein
MDIAKYLATKFVAFVYDTAGYTLFRGLNSRVHAGGPATYDE